MQTIRGLILDKLTIYALKKWVLWAIKLKKGKQVKYPYNPATGKGFQQDSKEVFNSANWVTYEKALSLAAKHNKLQKRKKWFLKPAFVMVETDDFVYIDLDNAVELNGTRPSPTPFALNIFNIFKASYREVSNSKRGYHLLFQAKDRKKHKSVKHGISIEVYSGNRVLALTGDSCSGDALVDYSVEFNQLIDQYLAVRETASDGVPVEWTREAIQAGYDLTDDELIKDLMTDRLFSAVWNLDISYLVMKFPSNSTDKDFDYSAADFYLAKTLLYATGKNCQRTEDLMRRSPLLRDKWDERRGDKTKLQFDILNAFKEVVLPEFDKKIITLENIKNELPNLFMINGKRILFENEEYDKDQVNNIMSGRYIFIDRAKGHTKPKKPFTALSEWYFHNQNQVKGTFWDPSKDEFFVNTERRLVNICPPDERLSRLEEAQCGENEPVVQRVIDHLFEIFDDISVKIILDWFSFLAKSPGKKLGFAMAVTGPAGVGKDAVISKVAEIISRNTKYVSTSTIQEKYNEYLFECDLIIGSDLRLTPKDNENQKAAMTQYWLPRRRMNHDVYTSFSCCNMYFSTNNEGFLFDEWGGRRIVSNRIKQKDIDDVNKHRYLTDVNWWRSTVNALNDPLNQLKLWYYFKYEYKDSFIEGQRPPTTSFTHDAVIASLGKLGEKAREYIEDVVKEADIILFKDFENYIKFEYRRDVSSQALGRVLGAFQYKKGRDIRMADRTRVNYWTRDPEKYDALTSDAIIEYINNRN